MTYWQTSLALALVVAAVIFVPRLIRHIRKERYFASDEFLAHKTEIASVVAEHNEIARYTSEIRDSGSFRIGAASTGSQAHLATFQNTSQHNYRRDRNVANYEPSNVHNCSLQVVRNAAGDPIKYLMKYFGIKPTEATLSNVEELGDSVSRLEDAVGNLQQREMGITLSFDPPAFILKHYEDEFMEHAGVELSPVFVPYPEYRFEYVSAGGNSSQTTSVELDTPTIDALIEALSQKIRFSRSAAGQRALMTAKLRGFIKQRDNYACVQCRVSLAAEPHLLLEVDHIMPVSRGGLSTIENLQTLCWRCNRTKSNKVAFI
ncbi:MAG: HNH endonuclease signature motif containing protein [Jatrophihabitantaceae bacterium]